MMWQTCQGSGGKGEGSWRRGGGSTKFRWRSKACQKDGAAEKELELPK